MEKLSVYLKVSSFCGHCWDDSFITACSPHAWQQSYGGKILDIVSVQGGIGTIAGFHLLGGAGGKLPHPPHRPQTLALFKVVPRQMNYYTNKN